MSERMNFSVELGKRSQQNPIKGRKKSDLSVVIVGAFDGGTGTGNPQNETKPSIHKVDIDTLDGVISRLQPALDLTMDGSSQSLKIEFSCMEDFHPDRLYPLLNVLRTGVIDDKPTKSGEESAQDAPAIEKRPGQVESEQQTLSRLLGKQSLNVEQRQRETSTIPDAKQSKIEDIVRRLAETSAQYEGQNNPEADLAHPDHNQESTKLLRHLLHNETFQALEASWRSIDWLLRSTEPDEAVHFYLLNAPRQVLERDLLTGDDPQASLIYQLIRQKVTDGPLSEIDLMLIDNHTYTANEHDMRLLDRFGRLVNSLNGSMFSAADRRFYGDEDSDNPVMETWEAFRKTPIACRISLLLPQTLLRLPYGADTDPIESFSFEELDESWSTKELLWGNPAYAQLILLVRQWLSDNPLDDAVITDLPAYSYVQDGERYLQSCTEQLLDERQIRRLLDLGLLPVIGSRKSNSIQIPWFQTLGQMDNT